MELHFDRAIDYLIQARYEPPYGIRRCTGALFLSCPDSHLARYRPAEIGGKRLQSAHARRQPGTLSSKYHGFVTRATYCYPTKLARGQTMRKATLKTIAPSALMVLAFTASPAFPQNGVVATQPYKLTTFAKAPAGLSAPDSIAVVNDHVFVGYGDNHAPDGSDGLNSQIVEFTMDGSVVHIYTVLGHNDA